MNTLTNVLGSGFFLQGHDRQIASGWRAGRRNDQVHRKSTMDYQLKRELLTRRAVILSRRFDFRATAKAINATNHRRNDVLDAAASLLSAAPLVLATSAAGPGPSLLWVFAPEPGSLLAAVVLLRCVPLVRRFVARSRRA